MATNEGPATFHEAFDIHLNKDSSIIDRVAVGNFVVVLHNMNNNTVYGLRLYDLGNVRVGPECDIEFFNYSQARALFETCKRDLLLRQIEVEPALINSDYFHRLWLTIKDDPQWTS